MEIEQVYNILKAHGHGDIIKCPECQKSGFVFCHDSLENVGEDQNKKKIPDPTNRAKWIKIRLIFFCLYCDFVCEDKEKLEKLESKQI